MLDQLVDLLVQFERYGPETGTMEVRCNSVIGCHGLTEFPITAGGRVAAGWLENRWCVVGGTEAS